MCLKEPERPRLPPRRLLKRPEGPVPGHSLPQWRLALHLNPPHGRWVRPRCLASLSNVGSANLT